ncbi:MAG: DUF3106 domain-containing protein [Stenotrophomonas nitritireducens]|uniref:DUF3106 domain-containing protein n=1 Tax=Stenotrophomonas nitritireducens TaxID=83617 RepID=UPI001ACD1A35|nr:DUF3106 domain-containing protein [Stenotrophomonas nitritireducens]MBN8792822.1 DUF3106 domain-containing protein [Stenotrophomonas nitritireducens]MBN8796415.1 DUF3106 domain-containing protein [Stenotrophomonas nitritireducens]
MRRIERLLPVLLVLLPAAPSLATPAAVPPSAAHAAGAVPDPRSHWSALAPAQQRELRARYAAWRALPESERQRVRRAAATMAALPAAEREALRDRFLGLDRLHRDGWRLGPQLGAQYPKLQPLLGYLPEHQREPMLALLRQLDAAQLAQLGVLSQRTPPQERDALRDQLLAVPAAGRADWLRQKTETR